jgi:hypothetical protein
MSWGGCCCLNNNEHASVQRGHAGDEGSRLADKDEMHDVDMNKE